MMFSIGTRGRRIFNYGLLAGLASIALAGAVTTAQALTLNGTFGFTIWQADVAGANINSPSQQAQLSNPLMIAGNLIATGTYTGDFDFDDGGINEIDNFLTSSGGVVNYTTGDGSQDLSSGGFDLTSVFLFTGNTGGSILTGVITHDDGMSLYLADNTPVALAPIPTASGLTNYAGLSGNWQMVYVAANDLPEFLLFDVTRSQNIVPLPAALPLFGTGLAALGFIGWRRKRKGATV